MLKHPSSNGLQPDTPEAEQRLPSHRSPGAPGVALGGAGATISTETGRARGREPLPAADACAAGLMPGEGWQRIILELSLSSRCKC